MAVSKRQSSDCSEFATGKLQCMLSNQAKPISRADILVAGPSCVNFSWVHPDAAKFVGWLDPEDSNHEECESSTAYIHGFCISVRCAFRICMTQNVAAVSDAHIQG